MPRAPLHGDAASAPTVARHTEIDGIRGWAALVVVLFHVFYEIFGVVQPELRSRWFFFLFDGDLAVHVFFVLSGDALSIGYLSTGRRAVIDRLLAKRYFRLTIPILMACLVSFVLMKAGWTYNLQAAPIVHREDWLGAMIDFVPNALQMSHYALYDVYAEHRLGVSYNPFMWTMSIEFIGSLLVFSFLYLSPALKRPASVAAAIAFALYAFNSWYALFFVGIVFGYLRLAGIFDRLQARKAVQLASGLALVALVVVISSVDRFPGRTHAYYWASEFFAAALVGLIYMNRIALAAFRSTPSRILGALSFPLYLIQFGVLVSYTSWMIVESPALTPSRILFIGCTSTILCLIAAAVFYAIEKPLLDLLDRVVRRHVRGSSA